MDSPRRRLDPLALAVIGVAVVLAVGLGAYLLTSVEKERVQDSPASSLKPAPTPTPEPEVTAEGKPVVKPRGELPPPPASLLAEHGVGRVWHYRVSVEPAVWREATLTYRIVQGMGVNTEFRHTGGQMSFHLGTLAAGHPSHANARFPGFFLHAAYLDRPLEVGQQFTWEWPWQLPGGQVRLGRVKRYVGEVKDWEMLPAPPSAKAPGNMFMAARIEATLFYIENGEVRASAAETLWYAPRFLQVVKVVRDGKTPDEPVHHIVAELVEHRYQ